MKRRGFAGYVPKGHTGRGQWPTARRKPVQREKIEQSKILQLAALVCVQIEIRDPKTKQMVRQPGIWVMGTRRSRGKPCPQCGTFVAEDQGMRQTAGHADLVIFLKARANGDRVRLLYWESKAGKNTTSSAQDAFLSLAGQAGNFVGSGDFDDFIAFLVEHHYIKADSVAHYRQPKGLTT